jgi:hypothetical protein
MRRGRDRQVPPGAGGHEITYFESGAKARGIEWSQEHLELLGQIMELVDGPPEYVDLSPVQEGTR